ncbi:hypothetical protein AGMMS49959_02780 [Planctomycetales bacterium]|nr:hypothetical protein AGMMS49959_02780 [Planctomycetales bacterium]
MFSSEVQKVIGNAKSLAFIATAEAADRRGLTVKVDDNRPGLKFDEWMPAAAMRCIEGSAPKKVWVVSGELSCRCWNRLSHRRVDRYRNLWDAISRDEEFSAQGICCPYVNAEKARGNMTFNFFRRMAKKLAVQPILEQRVAFFMSLRRKESHWVAIGDELRFSPWHKPVKYEPDVAEGTLFIRGEGVSDFAKELFEDELREIVHQWLSPQAVKRFNDYLLQNSGLTTIVENTKQYFYVVPRLLVKKRQDLENYQRQE